jgi:sarcosine oxidase gamma subunit
VADKRNAVESSGEKVTPADIKVAAAMRGGIVHEGPSRGPKPDEPTLAEEMNTANARRMARKKARQEAQEALRFGPQKWAVTVGKPGAPARFSEAQVIEAASKAAAQAAAKVAKGEVVLGTRALV